MSLQPFLFRTLGPLPLAGLAALVLLTGAGPRSAAALHVATDGDAKAPDPGFVYLRVPFDCTPLEVLQLTIGSAGSLANDTTGGTNQIDGYPCAPWAQQGPEHIYRLDVAAGDTLQFWAGLTDVSDEIDHDLFLLNACDTDSCLVGANTELTATLTGGSYYLIVDGAGGDQGPYSLAYESRYVGVSPLACLIATGVDLGAGEVVFEDNLFGQADFVRSYDCSPVLMRGGEKWYTMTLPAPTDNQWGGQDFSQFSVEFTNLANTLDVALWLFDGCGIGPQCLDFVNEFNAGIGERLTYRNETDQELTVYLGVDCWRNPSESGTGFFTLKISSDIVAEVEKKPLGSVRSLYR